MNCAIHLHNLLFRWPGQTAPVLDIGEWKVATGERIFLFGPSGSGKSTLLNLLAGIMPPQHGQVEVLGQALGDMGARARDRFRARHVGMVFQQFNLLPWLSVEMNIRLGAHFNRAATPPAAARILQLLERLALPANLLHQQAGALSVGQQQRVAVARALVNQPQLIIADEPTSALDSDARDQFIRLLLECASTHNSTLIFVSHDRSLAHHFSRQTDMRDINSPAASAGVH